MEFDPYEQFREDPGEMELSPEFQAQLELQQQAEELASEEPLTPTGEQPEPAPQPEVSTEPQIEEPTGLKFQNSNITNGSKFNLKVLEAGEYSIEVRDYFKNLTSKSIINAKSGDNVLKFYTRALQDGDYTITISKDGQKIYNVKLFVK